MDTTTVTVIDSTASSAGQAGNATTTFWESVWILFKNLTLELIRNPDILWIVLAGVIFALFFKFIRYELLPYVSGFKALGVEFSLAKRSLEMASESAQKTTRVVMEDIKLAEKSPQWKVIIPPKDQQRVLDRAKKNLVLFKDARILWIDDMPDTLRNEYKMLERLQIDIDLATSETEAEHRLQTDKYDLILSDIARGDDRKAGLEFLEKYAKREQRVPFIFYVGVLNPEKGVPAYAFGITHRPDELLHLIMDVLERVKS